MKPSIKKAVDKLLEVVGIVYFIASVVLPGGAAFWLFSIWGWTTWLKWPLAILIGLVNLGCTVWTISVFGGILGDKTKPTAWEYIKFVTPMVVAPLIAAPMMVTIMVVSRR